MRTLLLTAIALLLAGPARAEGPARTLDDLRRLNAPVVYVRDAAGTETKGRLLQITESTIVLLTDHGTREFAQPDIEKIDRRGDSVKDGAIVGAVLGAIAYASIAKAYGAGNVAALPLAMFFYSALGAGIDSMITLRTPLYRAPSAAGAPRTSTAGRGVAFAVRKTW